MKTITILSQKGGAGKTTIALSLAVSFERDGKQTIVMDIDPQASASKWFDQRQDDTPYVISIQAERLAETLETAKSNGGDIAIIDTSPNAENSALKACRVADLVLIPCRPSIYDINAIGSSIDIAKYANKKAFVIVNAIFPNATKMFRELQDTISEQYKIPVLEVYYSQRSAFVHSALEGKTAQEFEPNGKASEEERLLYQLVDQVLNEW
uniref:Chromosome partitioning protein n=1 Tax=Candidatus Kentrum sp. FM TaxID=2126340 RepID=A0A450VYG5_9GAMM|nr:MAG: chromosome partitioning protein [Candidatus Kentron sp. FM]VFJ53330.1 MAG: chromosome partitioning protein [Candidatus Kentron sp. FM]VFK09800.1 MAG: chromosome partitioning protein [Candidatus Kentron sp. FM]